MIRYFNPGHESAVLNASRYYQSPAIQLKMRKELAFLPAWYAKPEDFILVSELPDEEYLKILSRLRPLAKPITEKDLPSIGKQKIDLWGSSPQAIHSFELLNEKYKTDLELPIWKDEYKELSSRKTGIKCLNRLISEIPEIKKDILPVSFSELGELENYLTKQTEPMLAKSPHSSSGRGLLWLSPNPLGRSEQQIISGMLKKQESVSLEKALKKQLDFSIHYNIEDKQTVTFYGYSVFEANKKGAYRHSFLLSQEKHKEKITNYVKEELLEKIKESIRCFLLEYYAPYYKGMIGIDMLIYQEGDKYLLNPCIEINMRKTMGYLSLRLFDNYIHPDTTGAFYVDYYPDTSIIDINKKELQKRHPLMIKDGYLQEGYFPLINIQKGMNYHAYILLSS